MTDKQKSYPKLNEKNYWDIRARFNQAPKAKYDNKNLQVLLSSKEDHARHVHGYLISLGLIDENNSVTQTGIKWANDATYSEACQQMLNNAYDEEFLNENHNSRKDVIQYIKIHKEIGEKAASNMASCFLRIKNSTPEDAKKVKTKPSKAAVASTVKKEATPTATTKDSSSNPPVKKLNAEVYKEAPKRKTTSIDHNVNINIQIHISADADEKQIESIFKNMGKYLGNVSE